MYNLNVNLASAHAVNNLMVETGGNTPRTPEILNSLIAMSNPLDNYPYGGKTSAKPPSNMSSDSNSSNSSPLESPTNTTPSIQQTCSQLIKAGLKLSIEQKRKHQSDGEDLLDLDKVKRIKRNECSESEDDRSKHDGMQNWTWYENDDDGSKLTPEDEERRRRRRERNKIAATKCRLKKREKTANLVNESEILEKQHIELKSQLQEYQKQKRSLMEMLSLHRPQCQHNIAARESSLYHLPPAESHPYSRPTSVDPNYRLQEVYSRPPSAAPYTRDFTKTTPSIVVQDACDVYQPQLTNLDFHYNSQCHNNYNNQNYGAANGIDNGCMA